MEILSSFFSSLINLLIKNKNKLNEPQIVSWEWGSVLFSHSRVWELLWKRLLKLIFFCGNSLIIQLLFVKWFSTTPISLSVKIFSKLVQFHFHLDRMNESMNCLNIATQVPNICIIGIMIYNNLLIQNVYLEPYKLC